MNIVKGGDFIKKKLKRFREELGFTQEDVANELGVCKDAYGKLELGKKQGTTKTWLKIQEILCLSNDELVEVMKEDLFF